MRKEPRQTDSIPGTISAFCLAPVPQVLVSRCGKCRIDLVTFVDLTNLPTQAIVVANSDHSQDLLSPNQNRTCQGIQTTIRDNKSNIMNTVSQTNALQHMAALIHSISTTLVLSNVKNRKQLQQTWTIKFS